MIAIVCAFIGMKLVFVIKKNDFGGGMLRIDQGGYRIGGITA
jgi:hypothetical protein